ncbi:MAG TPA: hypothetical protein VJL29_13830 [Thermoguttaceae bacterium]|nr:hypothetical protein [Thermoguttaceae bacterium]
MSRNTKMRLLIGVAVILASELVGFVANFIMVLMATRSLNPNDPQNVDGAITWLDCAFTITAFITTISVIAFLFTLITLLTWLVTPTKQVAQES